jgi:hypothetical protein
MQKPRIVPRASCSTFHGQRPPQQRCIDTSASVFFNIKQRPILKSSSHVQTFKIKGLWKNNNGCTNARFHSTPTLSFILQRNANVRLSGISTAANATSASAEFLLQRTPTSDSACTSVSFDGCFRARRQPRTPTSCTMAKNFVDMCDNFKLTRPTTTTTTTTTPALFTPSPGDRD